MAVSSHYPEKCLEETEVADIELIEETLKQAISCPKTMMKFIQVAIPRLNEHSEGGTSDAEIMRMVVGIFYRILSVCSSFLF